jgi:hypothetical protein
MYRLMLLFWVAIAITCGAVVVYLVFSLGFNTSQRYLALRDARSKRQVSRLQDQPLPQEPVPSPGLAEGAMPSPDEIKNAVLNYEYESANIGGAVVVFKTIHGNNQNGVIKDKEIAILFKQVEDKDALVNVALKGTVLITEVKLITVDDNPLNRKFAVVMNIKNQTNQTVTVKIPKGQVFENKEMVRKQNLTAVKEEVVIIPSAMASNSQGVPVRINAFCLNKGFDLPDRSPGNITIFELKDKGFVNQKQLWDLNDKKLKEAKKSELLVAE